MIHLASLLFGSDEVFSNYGLWAFLSIGAVALFAVFIPLVTFLDNRRKEREAFYRAETFRRIAEAPTDGARVAVDLLREEDRIKRRKALEGMKMGGLINVGVGVGLTIFLRVLLGGGMGSPFLVGLVPGMIGVCMLVYVYFLAAPVD